MRLLPIRLYPFNEDWLALKIGLFIFALWTAGLFGFDCLGWVVTTRVWGDIDKALAPLSKSYSFLGGWGALGLTFLFLLGLLSGAMTLLKVPLKRFIPAFTVVFAIAYGSWIIGSWAPIAVVTPSDLAKYGLSWSLKLTNEAGYLLALIAGLLIANFSPKLADWLKEAVRPEFYIKIAIVLLGAALAVTAASKLSFTTSIVIRGVAAIIEAYLIYWAVVYFIARKFFGFSREWSVPLASGISICGVAAAIATGSAIRARPMVPVLVSSLVVIFAVVEVLILPFIAQTFLSHEPLVAAAWIGLAVKTDGAAVAGGGITEALILAKNAAEGINYQAGTLVATTTIVKVFIDIFIGFWAFLLGTLWTNYIQPTSPDQKTKLIEIWERFPKFILGYFITFGVSFFIALKGPVSVTSQLPSLVNETVSIRVIFFLFTFFSIGLMSNFRLIWSQGIGRLAAVYVISLFGFVIWVGLGISWLLFHGIFPPLVN
jgi:uncharacterized membrane protein YadS